MCHILVFSLRRLVTLQSDSKKYGDRKPAENHTRAITIQARAAEIKGGKRSARDVLLIKKLICKIISEKKQTSIQRGMFHNDNRFNSLSRDAFPKCVCQSCGCNSSSFFTSRDSMLFYECITVC